MRLQEWRAKYETDTKLRREELAQLKMARDNDLARLAELRQTYVDVKKFVAEDRAEKERIRAERELEERQARCALRVQSWWRGVMVRRCLGPYRKRKDLKAKLAKIQKGGKK